VLRSGNIALLLPHAVACSAWVLAQLGEASEALNRLSESERLLKCQQAAGIVGYRGWVYHAMGRACLLLGRLDEAHDLADRVVETSRQHPGFAAHAQQLLGDIATQPDRSDAEGGEACYRKALALAESHGMLPLAARCHLGLGELYRKSSAHEKAKTELTTAAGLFRSMEMTFWLERAEKALG
jgi:tetratricopeptide (TPR) repeat protein